MKTDLAPVIGDAGSTLDRVRSSWAWVGAAALSRAYVSLLVTLVAIATLPSLLGWQASVVQSGSMMPSIHPGDIAVTMPLPASRPVPIGRVVSFTSSAGSNADGEPSIRLHRIVADNQDGTFATRGDANIDTDSESLVRSQIVGQARLLIPDIGLPSLWLQRGQTDLFVIWALATMCAVSIVAFDLRSPLVHRHRRMSAPRPLEL